MQAIKLFWIGPILRFRIRAPYYAVVVLTLLIIGCSRPDDSWTRIQETGVLRVGVDPTFPPFALADDAGLRGIDVGLAHALAKDLGVEAQFSYFGYDGLYDALTTGQVDVLISALVVMPERTKDIAYSSPYFDAGLILVIQPADDEIANMGDLNGKSLAVELGALGHVIALDWQRKMGGLVIQPHDDVAEALLAVSTGDAQAALVDSVSGRLYLRDQVTDASPLKIVEEPVTSEPYAIAVRIDDRILLSEINESLSHLIGNGSLQGIIDRHLD